MPSFRAELFQAVTTSASNNVFSS